MIKEIATRLVLLVVGLAVVFKFSEPLHNNPNSFEIIMFFLGIGGIVTALSFTRLLDQED